MRQRWVALTLMVVGLAVAVSFGVIGFQKARSVHQPVVVVKTPSRFPVFLPGGQWEIYQLTATVHRHSLGFASYQEVDQNGAELGQTTVVVDGPTGSAVSLELRLDPTGGDTYRTGSDIYTGRWSFQARAAGTYSVTVSMPSAGQVVIARPVVETYRSLQWLVPAVFGAVCFIIGLIVFIRDLDLRRHPPTPVEVGPCWRSEPDSDSPLSGNF